MKIGLSIPRSPDPEGLRRFAQRAEQLGFESVLAGDHIVLPTGGTTQYPYTATGAFASPADEPFLETLTLLGYLAASTSTIKLGSTVIIVPYRNPVLQAKMFASLDVLSHGRLICGEEHSVILTLLVGAVDAARIPDRTCRYTWRSAVPTSHCYWPRTTRLPSA